MLKGISAIIITRNNLELLEKCLASVKPIASEIIVIDLNSSENLLPTIKKYGATHIKHPLVTVVEEIRQKVIKHAHHEYILFLDPDETLPKSLNQELGRLVEESKYDYFEIPRQNIVFGEWIKASRWWPDYQVRLFRQGAATWPTKLHSQPQLTGTPYHFPSEEKYTIQHQNYANLDEWFEKNRRYAKSDAKDRLKSNEDFNLTLAMKLSVSEFVSRIFTGRGYLDGMRGLILSILQSFYYFLVYAYYWEAKQYQSAESISSIHDFPRQWFKHGLSEILYWDSQNTNFVKKIKSKFVRKYIA